MPEPDVRLENETAYSFSGQLKTASLVYSIDED